LKSVQAVKVTMDQVLNSDFPSSSKNLVVPKKATVLSYNMGTLIETESGELYLATCGTWFRSDFVNKPLPQVSQFDTLQDVGLTIIKDKIVRNDNTQLKDVGKPNGQKVRSQNNVSPQKANKAVGTDPKSEKEN